MKIFTKWLIINSIVATGAIFASFKDLFSFIVSNDASYLSIVTMFLFVGLCFFTGKLALDADNKRFIKDKELDIGWFAAEHLLNLGLLGTVIGFCFMVNSSLAENKELNSIIKELKSGAATAVLTTIVGLVCSMILQLQLFVIQHAIKSK